MKTFTIGVMAIALASACSSSKTGSAVEQTGTDTKAFSIFPPQVFSGFDGTNTYKAPMISVNASAAVTWSIADPSVASLAPEGANLSITTMKAGDTTITAKSGDKTSTIPLKVYAYTADQYNAGKMRYMTPADAD